MVWAEVAKYLSGADNERVDDGQNTTYTLDASNTRRKAETMEQMGQMEDFEALRPPYVHV
jgi:hypothetical protein